MNQSTFSRLLRASALAVAFSVGCGGSEQEPHEHPDGGHHACNAIPDYFAGMEVSGAAGITVKLLDSQPAPPVPRGQNTWTIELRDAAGAAADGATIVARPWMPAHAHGDTPPAVTPLGNGRYQLVPVYFRMAGEWEITFDVTSSDGTTDHPVMELCIQG